MTFLPRQSVTLRRIVRRPFSGPMPWQQLVYLVQPAATQRAAYDPITVAGVVVIGLPESERQSWPKMLDASFNGS